MRSSTEIRDAILRELEDDYVGLWWIVSTLQKCYGISDVEEIRRSSLEQPLATLRLRGAARLGSLWASWLVNLGVSTLADDSGGRGLAVRCGRFRFCGLI